MLTTIENLQPDNDLGIDTRLVTELSRLILSRDIDLGHKKVADVAALWTADDIVEYGEWLCLLLGLRPGETEALKSWHVERASHLGLGPSEHIILKVLGGIQALQVELNFLSPDMFQPWTRNTYILHGQALARNKKGRPTREDLIAAYHDHKFPSWKEVKKHFGNIRNFHEAIGCPSVKGWEDLDYIDWGVAFKRQNGLNVRLTFGILELLSARGAGPSPKPVSRRFGISSFDWLIEEEYLARLAAEADNQRQRLEQAKRLAEHDEQLAMILHTVNQADILRVVGQYRLIKALTPTLSLHDAQLSSRQKAQIGAMSPKQVQTLATRKKADTVARSLINSNQTLDMGYIENTALVLGVFDDLWPMYRFQNVDLKIAA